MQLHVVDHYLKPRGFWGQLTTVGADGTGRALRWGCPSRPSVLIFDDRDPPEISRQEPDQKNPGGTTALVEFATPNFVDRNHVILRREDEHDRVPAFIGVRIHIPHGMTGVRPIEVYSPRGLETQRLFCDHGMSLKHGDGRSLLAIWGLVYLQSGDRARLLHVLPGSEDLLEVIISNREGRLDLKRRTKQHNAAPFPRGGPTRRPDARQGGAR